uniref:Uncharacterized protein n=1 Tax=Wuchereria bancrofti TaxID=6293 RepID=A0AAF5RTW6_WUCBA
MDERNARGKNKYDKSDVIHDKTLTLIDVFGNNFLEIGSSSLTMNHHQ